MEASMRKETAVFGGGCFWCTEAVFEELKGVLEVISGYAGGSVLNPTYEQVSSGQTGHAEVIQVEFDPSKIKYQDLLAVFFSTHDPTTANQQRNDIGTQYRSIILHTTLRQKEAAESFIKNLEESKFKGKRIVTEVQRLEHFFGAEEYHKQYYKNNPKQPYCQLVIDPKIEKLKKAFQHFLKSNEG